MSSSPVRHEHRAAQRFAVQLPVTLRLGEDLELVGITQDVSARGAFILIERQPPDTATAAFTVTLPREITLTESMRVRCHGKVLRVEGPGIGGKFGLAVVIENYEFLPEMPNQARPVEPAKPGAKFDSGPGLRAYPSGA